MSAFSGFYPDDYSEPHFIVKVLHYISFEETEEIVSYDIDLMNSFDEIFTSEDILIQAKEMGILTNPSLLMETVMLNVVKSIFWQEIDRQRLEGNDFLNKLAEMTSVICNDANITEVSQDFGEQKNMVAAIERVF